MPMVAVALADSWSSPSVTTSVTATGRSPRSRTVNRAEVGLPSCIR